MEGVVLTPPRQTHSDQLATPWAPARRLQPAPQPAPSQPSQPHVPAGQATAAPPLATPVTKSTTAPAAVWVTNDPALVFKTPSWPMTIAPRWETVGTLPQLPPRTQVWDGAAWAATWVRNDPAQVFKAPSWSVAMAPRWATIKTLPQLPPGTQPWDAAAWATTWATNDPAKVFKAPSWSVVVAPRWEKVQTLSHLPPGTQPWDIAASVYVWVTNDPAKVFQTPSWPMVIAPRWAKVKALPQLPPGTQPWELKNSKVPAASQPATRKVSKPTPAAQPVPSHPPVAQQPPGASVQPATAVVQGPSFEDAMKALVGQFTTCHVSEPATWAWSEPSVFGLYLEDKTKRKNFHVQLAVMANTMLPESDSSYQSNKVEPQQGIHHSALLQSLNDLPILEANGSSSAAPDAMIQEQPSEVVAPHENSTVPQIEQAHVPFPETLHTATAISVPTNNSNSGEAMETEASQPTDAGKGVALHGEPDLTGSIFQLDNVPQLFAEVNNPFINASTFPTLPKAPKKKKNAQQPRGQEPSSLASTASGAAFQDKPYEVGSDDDPNVDLEFDFGKYFKRAPRAPAAEAASTHPPTSSSPTANPAEISPPTVASNPAEASPTEVSAPAEVTPFSETSASREASPSEASLSSDDSHPTEASSCSEASHPTEISSPAEESLAEAPPALTSPAGPTALVSTSGPAEPVQFSAPPLPSDGLDFSACNHSPEPRGERKRLRETRSDSMYEEKDRHAAKKPAHPCLPKDMLGAKEQHERMKAIVAHLKANPHIAYDEEYAMTMMNEMFYDTLPSLVSKLMFPLSEWTADDQEDEAKYFVDKMLEDELNERSFEMVQEAYEPSCGFKFPVCRENLFEVFSEWFVKFIALELRTLVPNMTRKEIINLGDPIQNAIWKYMDDHPPNQD